MVPCCTELSGPELVLAGSSRSDRAFGDSRDAVVLAGVQLSNTVPVDTGSVMLEVVLDIDDDCVTPLCSYEWSRILTVDEHHLLGSTTSIGIGPGNIGDLEVVLSRVSIYSSRNSWIYLQSRWCRPGETWHRSRWQCCSHYSSSFVSVLCWCKHHLAS